MNYINIALLYKEMGDVKVAKSYFALAQEMAEPLGNLDYLREIYLGLKDIYSEEGDYKNALKYLEKAKTITDSLNSTRYNEKMAEMQQLHEVELKEIENQALRSENKLQQRKIFSQRIVQQSIIFLSILLAGFIVFIVISRMGIQKKNSQLVQKNAEIERQKTLLDQSNATKDSLFSIIAHDLRNPFNNILGFSQILEEEVQALKEPEIKAHATAIRKAGENAFALLQTLLDWSKTQRNLIQPYYIALNARTLLDEVLSNHQEMATRKNIRLENRVTADLDFQSDPHILHTIFRNLTVNALNHTPPGGLIWVAGKMEETVVTFEIGDTGPGIDPKQAERIFSLRNRFRDEDKPSPHDHGLGLIICKEFTDLLQGTIQLDSQIGQGSVFRIRLPLHHQVNPLQNTNTHDQHA